MFNFRVLVVIVLIAAIAAGIFFLRKNPPFKKDNVPDTNKQVITKEITQEILDESGGLIGGVKDFIGKEAQRTSQNLQDAVANKKDEVVSKLLKSDEQQIKVSSSQSTTTQLANSGKQIFIVDLSKQNNLIISVKKGSLYYLSFINAPANYCLYIKDASYPIINDKVFELEFNSSGSFSIKTNLCDLGYKEHGQFIVE